MNYIDTRLAENVWNGEAILAEIKAMGIPMGAPCCAITFSPNEKCRPQRKPSRRSVPARLG